MGRGITTNRSIAPAEPEAAPAPTTPDERLSIDTVFGPPFATPIRGASVEVFSGGIIGGGIDIDPSI